jgi:hypothetical protein
MVQNRHYTRQAAFVIGLIVTLTLGTARGQSAAAPHHRVIRLTSQKITLPFDNQVFAGDGEDAKIANSHCLMCHSKDLIDTQPPLTLATWKKEIEKMRGAYNCPLRADQIDQVAGFISHAAHQHQE